MPPIPVANLTILAYANRFARGAPPRKVAPIFQLKDNPTRLILPPFKLVGEYVSGGTVGAVDDLEATVEEGNATRLENPIQAEPDSVLWVEYGEVVHYDRASKQIR